MEPVGAAALVGQAARRKPSLTYVTNSGGSAVSTIDIATNTAGPKITVGSGLAGIAITPDGKTAYAVNPGNACTRMRTRGILSFSAHTGLNRVSFQGRISRTRKLTPGRYTLTIRVTNSAGKHSRVKTLRFTMLT
jgi:YVTN family beta-propeller protein